MKERIDRKDDEHLYQPKMPCRPYKELLKIGQETGLSIKYLLGLYNKKLCNRLPRRITPFINRF
jgi:hypothetical protein